MEKPNSNSRPEITPAMPEMGVMAPANLPEKVPAGLTGGLGTSEVISPADLLEVAQVIPVVEESSEVGQGEPDPIMGAQAVWEQVQLGKQTLLGSGAYNKVSAAITKFRQVAEHRAA